MKKPSIPKGTRDFSPVEVTRRTYIMDTIKARFATFGFQPIETPSFENSETLMGKYGEEGDRLIFKILESGDYLKWLQSELKVIEKILDVIFEVASQYKDLYFKSLSKKRLSEDRIFFNEKIDYITEKNEVSLLIYSTVLSKIDDIKNNVFYEKFKDFLDENRNLIAREAFVSVIYKKYGVKAKDRLRSQVFSNLMTDSKNSSKFTDNLSKKALRYDLTVPFARYVVQHQNDITFPFKRYQIQPVWRADRPQKGRFREFYQCDADVVGSKSLWQEVELVQLYDTVFNALQLKGVTIKMNNRKILSGIAEMMGAEDKLIDFTVALDKLDKIGEDKVKAEMRDKGIADAAIAKLQPLFSVTGTALEKLDTLKELLADSAIGMQGITELAFIIEAIESLQLSAANLEIDVTLARGLNYYTGAIFEVAAPEGVAMGSIGGGGRYDDLTGIFGMKDMSGVGISFGLDRIYLVLEELDLFPETVTANSKVLFINFGDKEALYAMKAITALRSEGINAELYPDTAKMGKQMGYADKRAIPYVVLAGASEIAKGNYTLKNMKNGEQELVSLAELSSKLK